MAEVASAFVSLVPSARGFGAATEKQVGGEMGRSGKKIGSRLGSAVKVGALAAMGGATLAVGFLKGAVGEAREAQKVGALTNSVIKATGGVANVTAGHVSDLAGAISSVSGIDDEVIQSGQNMLLTFKNIRNEAGKGNDIFDQTSKTLVDMSAAMGTEPKQAAIQLGKALNDPIKGVAALGRVGVTFTEGQKEQIKTLVKSGKTMDAQRIVLKELNSEFGGAAAAQATAGEKASVAWGNLKEQIGTALLPVIDRLATTTTEKIIPAVSGFVTGMQDGTGAGGDFADVLKDTYETGKKVVEFLDDLPGPVKKIGLEVGIATIAFSKINKGIGGLSGNMTTAETRTNRLGGAMRNLAGAGGVVLLTAGLRQSNKATGTLMTTLGGAAAGFGAAGPVGLGIGAGIGLFIGLKRSIQGTNDVRMPTPKQLGITAIIDGLNQADGAATKFTRNNLFKFLSGKTKGAPPLGFSAGSSTLATAKAYGIPDNVLLDAMLGNVKAFEQIRARLNRAVKNDKSGNGIIANDRQSLIEDIQAANKARRAEALEIRRDIAATGDYQELLKGMPPELITKIKSIGLPVTLAGVEKLAEKLDLTPEQVETVIKATHVPATLADIRKINQAADYAARVRTAAINVAKGEGWGLLDKLLSTPTINLSLGLFGGGKASGGPVAANKTYLVGERGPELFTSSQSGRITPNHRLVASPGRDGGASGPMIQIGEQTVVAHDYDDFLAQQQRRLRQSGLDGVRRR